MSMDKSLRAKSSLERHRNVLSRAERIGRLKEMERWEEGREPFGLPKVAHRKAAVGGKEKAKKEETPAAGAPAAPGAAPTAAAATPATAAAAPKKADAKKPEAKKSETKK